MAVLKVIAKKRKIRVKEDHVTNMVLTRDDEAQNKNSGFFVSRDYRMRKDVFIPKENE